MVNKNNSRKNGAARNADLHNGTFKISSETETEIKPSGNNSVNSGVRGSSLRTKAIAFAIAMGVLPVLAVGTLTYYLVNQSTTKDVTQTQQQKANFLADNINRFLVRRYGDIQTLSKLTFLQNRNLKEVLSREQIQTNLNNYLDIQDNYESIAVFDLDGNVISESKGQSIPNQKDQEYFQSVLKTNKPYISQPLTTKSVETAEIYLAAPVKDSETGKAIYIIRTDMPVKSIAKAVNIPQISQDDYDLIDASGNFFQWKKGDDLDRNALESFVEWKQLQAEDQVTTRILFNKKDNAEELVTYLPLPKVEGLPYLKWKLVLSTPTATAFLSQKQLLLFLQIGTLSTALLFCGIAVIIAKRFWQQIPMTANMAPPKLGQGNLDTRNAIKGKSKLAVSRSHINDTADQLQEQRQKPTDEAEQLKFLTNILLLIRASLNSKDLFNITVTQARLALKADRVVIYQLNALGGGQIIAESVASGLPVALGKTIESASVDQEIIEAYRKGRVQATNNVSEAGFAPEYLRLMEQLQINAELVTPIVKDNQVFGFLIAHHCFSSHVWQTDEINFLQQLTIQIGLTLERVSLLEATQALKDFTINLSRTLNSQDVYDLAVQNIRQALKADRAVIYQFDENWLGSIIAESVIAGWPCSLGAEIRDPCFLNYVEKYRQGRVLAINNIYQAGLSPCYIQQLEPFAVKANLVAPILLGDQLLGLLIVHQCSQPRVWQHSEIYLCEQLARIVGLALERTHVLEQTKKDRGAVEIVSQEQRQQEERLQLQLLRLLDDLEGASRGDLTVRAQVTSGEIGTVGVFFNSIMESLREIIASVKLAAVEVDAAIAQNSGAIAQLAIKALQQADQINHSLNSVDQIGLSIKEVATRARHAVVVVRTASRAAKTGGAAMDLTVENILSLEETIGETYKKVKALEKYFQGISRVETLIQQIAMQSNLLAINTGIEAVRAGEQGQGFAVIAEEVALLAARCTEVSEEVEGIATNIQLETSVAIKAMELDSAKVFEGTRLVQNTKQSLSQMLSVFPQIDELVQSISAVTLSNMQTSQQVTNVMKQIAQVSEETGDASYQLSTSVQKTMDISQKLQASVSSLKIH